jgi:uncharacterized protein YdeI (BOF family)
MKKIFILLVQIIFIFPSLAQEDVNEANSRNITRQGFGKQIPFDMGVGFINKKANTEGSAYYFDEWHNEGIVYTKDKGKYKIKKVNINLYSNKFEAMYDSTYVYTFDTKNLIKIVIDNKIFRVIKIKEEPKIFELFFNGKISIYKYYNVNYSRSSRNPMVNRKTNKYIKKAKYFLFSENKLTRIKLSKKSFSKFFQSDKVSQQSTLKFINENKLSLSKENDLIKVLNFVSN